MDGGRDRELKNRWPKREKKSVDAREEEKGMIAERGR